MTLKEKINDEYLKAFKEKDTWSKNILSVIKGEIQNIEKLPHDNKDWGSLKNEYGISDEGVIIILNKMIKSLKENLDDESKYQLDLVQKYLPKQMSKDEIKLKVVELVNSGSNSIGLIMKEFSKLPADKKVVSEVIKEVL